MPSQSLQDRRCAQPPDPLALDEVRGQWQAKRALTIAAAGGPLDVFMAGDDAQAKARVSAFIESLGLRPMDVGDLSMAHGTESAGSGSSAKAVKLYAPATRVCPE